MGTTQKIGKEPQWILLGRKNGLEMAETTTLQNMRKNEVRGIELLKQKYRESVAYKRSTIKLIDKELESRGCIKGSGL